MPHRVKQCEEILGQKLDEYIATHKEWHEKGLLCPHRGDRRAHLKMDEIMQDVEQAHDMLHAAMRLAGQEPHDYGDAPVSSHPAAPAHAAVRKM